MGRSQRQKGQRGEREAAKRLQELTGADWRRNLLQVRGGGQEGADVVSDAFPDLHVEVKRGKRPPIRPAMKQAVRDLAPGATPIVMTRADGEEWLVTMRADDWACMLLGEEVSDGA